MPELDGCQAARAIRTDTRNASTTIVALTASIRFEDEARASAAGMDAYIRTPIESSALLGKLLQIGTTASAKDACDDVQRRELEALAPSSRGHSRPLLDSRTALARINGDLALYRRLLQRFLSTHSDDARNLRAAHTKGDTARAIQIAHTLASAAANIGASQLQYVASGLEVTLSCNEGAPTEWLDDFERAHEVTLTAAAAAWNAFLAVANGNVDAIAQPSALLGRARTLIENHDTAAVECIQSLRVSLAGEPSAWELLKRLEVSVQAYDFARARADLDALAQALNSNETVRARPTA
jgi:HPt (histidine-containing phosphotransfer) domain-containing protein